MKKKDAENYREKITDVYLCVLLLIYPLWFGLGGYANITEAKYGFFKWSALIYIAVIVLITLELLLIGKAWDTIAGIRRLSVTQICVLAYVLCCCLSAVMSKYGSKVWIGAGRYEGLSTILLYAAIFMLVSCFGKFKKWHLYLLGAAILINTLIGVLQYAGYNPFTLYPQGYTYHDGFKLYSSAFLGTLGNIDLLSAFLSLTIPLFYTYYILHPKSNLLLIPIAAGIFLLLLSGVSAGVVGLGIGVFITIPLVANSKQSFTKALTAAGIAAFCAALYKCLNVTYVNRVTEIHIKFGLFPLVLAVIGVAMLGTAYLLKRYDKVVFWDDKKVRRIFAVSIAIVVILISAAIWVYPFANGTLSSLHQLLHGRADPKLGSSRIQIWQHVIKLVPEHLWFGGGPDTLAERMTFSFQNYNATLGTTVHSYIDTAHNDYLNVLVNTGIFSLLCYLSSLFSAALRTLRDSFNNKTALIIFVALLCYLIQIFFSFSICIISPLFWAIFGLLEATLRVENKRDVIK